MNPGLFPVVAAVRFQARSGYPSSGFTSVMFLCLQTAPGLRAAMRILASKDALKPCGSQCLVFTEGFYGTDSAVCTVW